MNNTPPALTKISAPTGYLSEDHKKKFTITAGILGAAFFVAQFILPFIMMAIMMPTMMFFRLDWMKEAKVERGAYWDGAVWFIETSVGPNDSGKSRLKKLVPGSEEEPVFGEDLSMEKPWLLADKDKLWIISSSKVGYYQDGKINLETKAEQLGDICRPFFFDGKPSVIEKSPSGLTLMVLRDNGWQGETKLSSWENDKHLSIDREFQVLSDEGDFHVFRKFESTVYYLKGFPNENSEQRNSWQPVSSVGYKWHAALIDGKPTIFRATSMQGPTSTLEGLRLEEGEWRQIILREDIMVESMAAYQLEKKGKFVLLTQSFPGSLRVIELDDFEIVSEKRHGRGFPFPPGMMTMMFIPHLFTFIMPFVLALILSASMRKHRVCEFESETAQIPYASIALRAMAQVIDALILGGPVLIGYSRIMSSVFDLEQMFVNKGMFWMLSSFGLILGGFLWAFIGFLIFSVLEGKSGVTPGKWVMGIRVLGTDLRPCGFGRAIVRNFLKFVDGFFNFMVGVLIVALSENWQRVGDMAARTIVVDTRKTGSGGKRGRAFRVTHEK